MGQGQAGQRQSHLIGFSQGNPHVLDEVFHKEPGIKVIVDDSWS